MDRCPSLTGVGGREGGTDGGHGASEDFFLFPLLGWNPAPFLLGTAVDLPFFPPSLPMSPEVGELFALPAFPCPPPPSSPFRPLPALEASDFFPPHRSSSFTSLFHVSFHFLGMGVETRREGDWTQLLRGGLCVAATLRARDRGGRCNEREGGGEVDEEEEGGEDDGVGEAQGVLALISVQ